jgi:hypothetical protein
MSWVSAACFRSWMLVRGLSHLFAVSVVCFSCQASVVSLGDLCAASAVCLGSQMSVLDRVFICGFSRLFEGCRGRWCGSKYRLRCQSHELVVWWKELIDCADLSCFVLQVAAEQTRGDMSTACSRSEVALGEHGGQELKHRNPQAIRAVCKDAE